MQNELDMTSGIEWQGTKSQVAGAEYYGRQIVAVVGILITIYIIGSKFGDGLPGILIVAAILAPLVPLGLCAWKYLSILSTSYQVKNGRLLIRMGVLNRSVSTLELYRVTDLEIRRPMLYRMFDAAIVVIYSSDQTGTIVAMHIDDMDEDEATEYLTSIRDMVERARRAAGVRTLEGIG